MSDLKESPQDYVQRSGSQKSEDEYQPLPDDVYNLAFICEIDSWAFVYTAYVYLLKLSFFTFLALEACLKLKDTGKIDAGSNAMLLTAQFLMLPVAVVIQDDLISTFFIVTNLKYVKEIERITPNATKWKFYSSNFCRGLDGFYSLFVNFVILLTATDVLSVFLNFAALQFLQMIDNLALQLATSGYLTDQLEVLAGQARDAELPRNNNTFLRSMDSILFFFTILLLIIGWSVWHFGIAESYLED